jgi:hypothetical protein
MSGRTGGSGSYSAAGMHPRIDVFSVRSYCATMWGKSDELRLSVLMGLRRELSLVRGMRRALADDEQHKVAGAIVEHLERSNWKIEQGPIPEGHGPHFDGERTI